MLKHQEPGKGHGRSFATWWTRACAPRSEDDATSRSALAWVLSVAQPLKVVVVEVVVVVVAVVVVVGGGGGSR